MFLLFDNIKK